MSLYESIVRPAAFLLDAERVHELAMAGISRGLFQARPFADTRLEQTLLGLQFTNPLGLAAGFDKNAAAVPHWSRLGFGHVECGTVTLHPQPGNPKPRLFRLPSEQALINRLGFNNIGAQAVAGTLAEAHSRARIPVGINLGKSKVTPLEQAAEDYVRSYRLLLPFGDYFVVNVSSPNTPGLRSLQERGPLTDILSALREVDPVKPMFVKVSPDLATSALDDVVRVAHETKMNGLIATNTTVSRDMLPTDPGLEGGLSGRPLKAMANQMLAHLYRSCDREVILIGVGGIFGGEDIYEKVRLGAHLCQVYTGWIYGGPQSVPIWLEELCKLMDRDGIQSLSELRGQALA